jgi:hypothetical protein
VLDLNDRDLVRARKRNGASVYYIPNNTRCVHCGKPLHYGRLRKIAQSGLERTCVPCGSGKVTLEE